MLTYYTMVSRANQEKEKENIKEREQLKRFLKEDASEDSDIAEYLISLRRRQIISD